MKDSREAVAFDIPLARLDGGESEPALAQCVSRAVRRFLIDRGEHEPDDLYAFVMREVERPLLQAVFDHTDGNQTHAASILGIARGTLLKKLRSHSIR